MTPSARIATLYFLFFSAGGISLPFFGGYLKSQGLSGQELGLVLAISPVAAIVFPPLWGQLADRTGRPGAIVTVLLAGAALGHLLLSQVHAFWLLLGAYAVHAAFGTSITSMLDTLALNAVEGATGAYAGLRRFGSIGFVVTSALFGALVDTIDWRILGAMIAGFAVSAVFARAAVWHQRVQRPEGPKASAAEAYALLRRPAVRWLLAASALHWIASAPYHGTLSIHVEALGLGTWVTSGIAGLGVLAEVVVMSLWPRLGGWLPPRGWLWLSFASSGLRWFLMGTLTSPWALIALGLMHALTFGSFYLSSVAWMSRCAPGSLRATGQTLYVAVTFGIGGLVGYLGSGIGLDAFGSATLFQVSALAELLPCLALFLLPSNPEENSTGAQASVL